MEEIQEALEEWQKALEETERLKAQNQKMQEKVLQLEADLKVMTYHILNYSPLASL